MLRPLFALLAAGVALGTSASAAPLEPPPKTSVSAPQRISVRTVGRGPDVVLIPGLGGSPEIWDDIVRRFRGRARLHLVQVAGFAGAPAGPNAQGPVLAPVSDSLAAHLRSHKLQGAKLVGHSTGGKLALMTAARHPELTGGVMVVDMLPFFGLALLPSARGPSDVRPVAEAAKRGVLGADDARFRAEQGAAASRYARSAASREMSLRGVLASDRRVYAQAMSELIATDLRPELGRIKGPVTVVYAQADDVVGFPVPDVDALYRRSYSGAPQVRLIPIPNSSHMVMHDQPNRLACELEAFVASEVGSPAGQAPRRRAASRALRC